MSKVLPHSNDITMAQEIVRFDTSAFDMVLRSHGVLMDHYRAIKCPLGVDDRFDVRTHGDHNCSNGFIYRLAGVVKVFFSSNSSISRLEDMGILDGSTVQVTIPKMYEDKNEEVAVQHYDRFFLKEVVATSVNTQLVEAHVTGTDRLQYLAVSIEFIMDSTGKEYAAGIDYIVNEGHVKWIGVSRPGFNPTLGRGVTYTIRYRYCPFWYVKNILHEVRVCRVFDIATGQEKLERMPHSLQLQREYMFENEERMRSGMSDTRDVKSPRSGSFGPR